ncbi:hypothetical protein FNW02_03670 [Komarekiella sp. 'clone 1']|uniref:Uncharacterized protein n=1 Tax=Komarekiella delphini-convector SJRDD-AB1 TaxID=2593771 RepID=A0AA40VQA3_9NOST|nr:hypothetical protein [Komarekiella delphini-convector]MBD6614971.1 hypothetical protein [Komarekiella delphini-convector SJRDD-AB1]
MTPSVADKTPIPAKVWRRHTDPPGLWIAVVIGSVSLHLLAFWLIRSSQFSRLWQQENKATIPIEVVEISSQTPRARKVTSKPKPVSPRRPSTTQKLRAANSPKQVVPKDNLTAKITPSTQDRSAIAFAKNKKAIAEQLQRQQAEQLQRQQAEQLQRQQAEQLQRQQAEQLQRQQAEQLQREQAEQLQRQQAEQLQRQQAEQLQRQQAEQLQRQQAEQLQRQQAEQLQRQQAEQLQRQQAEQLQRQQAEQLQRQQAEQLQRQQAEQTNTQGASSQTSNAPIGSLLASLVGEPQQVDRDRHNNPARIKISDEPFPKGLEYVKFIERKPGQPVEFTVILTISEKGKLEKIDIEDEGVPEDERSYYEDFVADQVFKGWEFEPAYDNDPNDPKPSNLMVRIRIEPLP